RKGIGWTLALACGLAGAAFLYLAFVSPPFSPWWRVGGMAVVGFAAGLLHTAIFHAISPMYRHDLAATVNLASILFGLGCFSLGMLALYWLALTVGRAASQCILPRARHGRLLLTTVTAAMFGCVILGATNNKFGAITGILLVGGAFAPIYPLVVEKIGHRFPYYHPGFYNGIFSLAMAGGLLTPGLMGYFASLWGLSGIMMLPLIGSIVVFVLVMLIWLESRLSSHTNPPATT